MLEILSKGFKAANEKLSGVRELTEQNVDEALRDVRMSLLEADVDFQVVKDFLGHQTVATTENYYINTKPALRAAGNARKVRLDEKEAAGGEDQEDGGTDGEKKM